MFLLCKGSIEKNTTSFTPSFSLHKKPFQGINRGKSLTALVVWLQASRRWPRPRVAPEEPAPHIIGSASPEQQLHVSARTFPANSGVRVSYSSVATSAEHQDSALHLRLRPTLYRRTSGSVTLASPDLK
jgi:hypothetical protein